MWRGLQGTWPRQGLLVQGGIPSHAGCSVQPQGTGRSYSLLRWVFHLANTAQARSRQRTQGIFMEEVHASNSLSSSKLAAPAQKDLGAVNNSVWLRDFHFAGPRSPIPQGPVGAGCLLLPSRCSARFPAPFRRAAEMLPARVSPHRPPAPSSPFSASPSPAPRLHLFLHLPVLCLPPPPLPRPSLPCST